MEFQTFHFALYVCQKEEEGSLNFWKGSSQPSRMIEPKEIKRERGKEKGGRAWRGVP
jgi:hypothetical protein